MKCIECDKDAEYVFSGYSVCKEHFEALKSKKRIQVQNTGLVIINLLSKIGELKE